MGETLDRSLPDDGDLFRILGAMRKAEEHTSTTCLLETVPDMILTRSTVDSMMVMDGMGGRQDSERLGYMEQGG